MAFLKQIQFICRHFFASMLRHPCRMLLLLLLLLAASGFILSRGTFSADISKMLPDDSESAELYRCINDSGIFNKTILFFTLPESFPDSGAPEYLERLVPELLRAPGIQHADYRFNSSNLAGLSRWIPQYFQPEDITAEPGKKVRELYKQMLRPGLTAMVRDDPFHLNLKILSQFDAFRKLSGMNLSLKYPYFVSPDEKHVFLFLETDVPLSDPARCRELLSGLNKILESSPFPCEVLTVHKRTAENEKVLKSDLQIVAIVSFLVFTLLTVLLYRCDLRSLLIPLMPFLASLPVLALMSLLFRETLFFVIGMGGVVAGLAVDYGIHIYAAVRGGAFPARRLFRIVPPLFGGMLTSAGVLLIFLFSAMEGCRQLGFFAGGSLLATLLLMLVFLPPALGKNKRQTQNFFRNTPVDAAYPRLWLFIWILLLGGTGAGLVHTRIDTDVRQFDVSSTHLDAADRQFESVFQNGGRPAFALFQGDTANEVLKKISRDSLNISDIDFFTPADLYPSEEIRKRNLKRWKEFAASEQWRVFREKLTEAGKPYGFSEDFFGPFFHALESGIHEPPEEAPGLCTPVLRRLLPKGRDGRYTGAVLFPDTPETIRAFRSAGALVVSQSGTEKQISRDISTGIGILAAAALLLVLAVTWILLRKFSDTLLALLPVLSALIVTLGIFAWTGMGINIAFLIGAIILCGLSVDYGIFIVHALKNAYAKDAFHAITLSALTSAAGAFTVVFTRHPMLRDAGLTLLTGIPAAWFCGLFVIPVLRKTKIFNLNNLLKIILPVFPLLLFCSCKSVPFDEPPHEKTPPEFQTIRSAREKTVDSGVWLVSSGVVLEYRFREFTFLSLLRVNMDDKHLELVCFTPTGAKLLECAGTPETLERWEFPMAQEFHIPPEKAVRAVLDDLAAIYFDNTPDFSENDMRECGWKRIIVQDAFRGGTLVFRYAGTDGLLFQKIFSGNKNKTLWQADYFKYIVRQGCFFPVNIIYDNERYGYRLVIRTRTVEKLR